MSLAPSTSNREIVINQPLALVFRAYQDAGKSLGTVTRSHPGMEAIAITKVRRAFTRPTASVLRISFEEISEERTLVVLRGAPAGGPRVMGFSSAAINQLVRQSYARLAYPVAPRPARRVGIVLLLIMAAAGVWYAVS